MIYVIAGYPRSGTSMMMAALEAGGLPVAKSAARERHNRPDGTYRPNRDGLYELPTVEQWEPGWPRQHDGKAVKCLVRWLRHLCVHDYRVVFMRRDPEEIRQSYRAAFGEETTVERIEAEITEARAALANRRDVRDVQELWYGDVLERPEAALLSLDWPIDVQDAASVVEPRLYRFRREKLIVGL